MILLACRSGALGWLTRPLAAVGRMALTSYLMQPVICGLLFLGSGFGPYGELRRHQLDYVVGAVRLARLRWSPLRLRHFRFGPFEWLWRSLTYWRRQPVRGGA